MKENWDMDPEMVTGTFSGSQKGFGFISVPGMEEDLFVPMDYTRQAFHGDTVMAMIVAPAEGHGKRAQAHVTRILKRAFTELTGVYQKNKKYGFVVPDLAKIPTDIFIPPKCARGAKNGQRVVVEITDYGSYKKSPEGKIKEILGDADDPSMDSAVVVRAFQIPDAFPKAARRQARMLPDEVPESDKAGRTDLRDLLTVTIDGADTKDFDDAISLTRVAGGFRLGVHIADVSHYVTEGSPLDQEAIHRGTSVYLPGLVVPMLPEALSNGLCSLKAGEDRLTLSCLITLDEKGRVTDHQIMESVIRVDRRLTYPQASEMIEAPDRFGEADADILHMLKDMHDLSLLLREKRRKRGGIDFDLPESKITLDEKGFPVKIEAYDRNEASRLIEDFMLLANETVAEDFYWQELPFVYRCHEAPDTDRIRRLFIFIRNFGYQMNIRQETVHPGEFQKLLGRIEGMPEEVMITRLVLRSMQRAAYTTSNYGHFGLAASCYCHFTSPIRRYPDLQIHRIIKEHLKGGLSEERQAHYRTILPDIAAASSVTERRADEAEREVNKIKKAEYMSQRIGQCYDGVISGLKNWGIYVELPNTCEGLIRLEDLWDDYYLLDDNGCELTGEDHGRVFRLGDPIRIRVLGVDMTTRTVAFEPADEVDGRLRPEDYL